MNETPISRSYRDTRFGSIGGGADEIMAVHHLQHMGILPANEQVACNVAPIRCAALGWEDWQLRRVPLTSCSRLYGVETGFTLRPPRWR